MATITKRDMVIEIANRTGKTQQQVFEILQHAIDYMTDNLAQNNEVVLRNFGSLQVKVTKQKIGRNPNKPGTDVVIPPRAIVKFKPGKELKERVAKLIEQMDENGEVPEGSAPVTSSATSEPSLSNEAGMTTAV